MKVEKLTPELNKVYFIETYSLFHILEGKGDIQVDFKNYDDWDGKLIFLKKGQYIKFLSASFVVRKIEFPNGITYKSNEVRVLFNHLVSLGYINFAECDRCQKFLSDSVFSSDGSDIIDASTQQWFWQNPFRAKKEEYYLIFDIKEVIDSQYQNKLSNDDLADLLNLNRFKVQSLVKDKIGISLKRWVSNKKLLESKKAISFTDKSIKEIAFEQGFNDPAYFNRFFKKETGLNPKEFRDGFDFENRDHFVQDILDLLAKYHTDERKLDFYADKMHMSVQALSRKVRGKLNVSLGKLIRYELVDTSKTMLLNGASITEVAYRLGFEEPNHFSEFFKRYTSQTPSEFILKKVQ